MLLSQSKESVETVLQSLKSIHVCGGKKKKKERFPSVVTAVTHPLSVRGHESPTPSRISPQFNGNTVPKAVLSLLSMC